MNEILLGTFSVLYGSVAILTLVAYYPTIVDLYHHKKPSANFSTYLLWSLASGIGFLYGIFVLPDVAFLLNAGVNFFANTVILFLRLRIPH